MDESGGTGWAVERLAGDSWIEIWRGDLLTAEAIYAAQVADLRRDGRPGWAVRLVDQAGAVARQEIKR